MQTGQNRDLWSVRLCSSSSGYLRYDCSGELSDVITPSVLLFQYLSYPAVETLSPGPLHVLGLRLSLTLTMSKAIQGHETLLRAEVGRRCVGL
jgi:hypothetical protein